MKKLLILLIFTISTMGFSQEKLDISNQAIKAYSEKRYKEAGDKFLLLYRLYKKEGIDSPEFKYNAAVSYMQIGNWEQASLLLEDLNNLGYSKNIEEPESFYENLIYAYYQSKQWKKGIEQAHIALSKFPDNESIAQLLASLYYESGDSENFKKILIQKINSGNANSSDCFNLGVLMGEENNFDEAKKYYLKAIDLDKENANAYFNLGALILSQEEAFVNVMNINLNDNSYENEAYQLFSEKRKEIHREALPYLEKAYKYDPENRNNIDVLMQIYASLGKEQKLLEFEKKYGKQTDD